jgi:hypothetical protein
MSRIPDIASIRCSLQVALLGEITPNLRGVEVKFDSTLIEIFFYYYSFISEDEYEISEIVGSEVISGFTSCLINVYRDVVPEHIKLPQKGLYVYRRKE